MKQEDKNLLLKDLCARLPYNVVVHYCNKNPTLYTNDYGLNERLLLEFRTPDCCVELKPYLRPMSNMTEEEKSFYEYYKEGHCSSEWATTLVDWLIKNHFDYRDLILKGLALPAPEGMYNK